MVKWYEDKKLDSGVVISSRVRLARNIEKYPFCRMLKNQDAVKMIEDVKGAIINDRTPIGESFEYVDMGKVSRIEKAAMLENHIISSELAQKKDDCGVIIRDDNAVSIMVNEEDHIRIQAVMPGYNIDGAWELASRIDDLIGESVKYAYDKQYGYLTSCVTNTGTGLRASFMVHIPMLEKTNQLRNILGYISKFGMTIRGIYGEGSEPLGSIYQISNQVTLGKSEADIINGLKNITEQIIEKEQSLREKYIKNNREEVLDRVYRAYGLLSNCKLITSKEAVELLSELRCGIVGGLISDDRIKANVYNMMMNVQAGNLQLRVGGECDSHKRDIERATYLNSMLA